MLDSMFVLLTSSPVPFDVTEALTDGVATVSGNIYGALGIVVPAAIGIVGAVVAVKFGIKWLRSLGRG